MDETGADDDFGVLYLVDFQFHLVFIFVVLVDMLRDFGESQQLYSASLVVEGDYVVFGVEVDALAAVYSFHLFQC
jgi:hypothetical protein